MFHILNFKTKILTFVALLFILLFVVKPVLADHATELYKVEILLVDESASARRTAFKQGLDEIFIRISGDSIIMSKLKRPAATTYIKQYSYDPVEKPTINPQGVPLTQRITIHYNKVLMEKYLQQNGFPVWGERRPETVVWLAVRDGRNEYVLKQGDSSLLKAATDEALIRRGIATRWPLYDAKDKKVLNIADIRGGFKAPVTTASKRYSRGPALTGSMIWNGKQWQSSWSLLMPSKDSHGENRHWNLTGVDHKLLINKAVDQAADALGVVFAIHGSARKQQLKTIRLNIQDVNSIKRYRHIERYLTGLNAVDSVKLFQIDGQSVVLEVSLRSRENDFISLLTNDAELEKVEHKEIERHEIVPQEIASQEIEAQKIQDNEASPGLPDSTKEMLNVTPLTNQPDPLTVQPDPVTVQPDPVTVYYYRLLK